MVTALAKDSKIHFVDANDRVIWSSNKADVLIEGGASADGCAAPRQCAERQIARRRARPVVASQESRSEVPATFDRAGASTSLGGPHFLIDPRTRNHRRRDRRSPGPVDPTNTELYRSNSNANATADQKLTSEAKLAP